MQLSEKHYHIKTEACGKTVDGFRFTNGFQKVTGLDNQWYTLERKHFS